MPTHASDSPALAHTTWHGILLEPCFTPGERNQLSPGCLRSRSGTGLPSMRPRTVDPATSAAYPSSCARLSESPRPNPACVCADDTASSSAAPRRPAPLVCPLPQESRLPRPVPRVNRRWPISSSVRPAVLLSRAKVRMSGIAEASGSICFGAIESRWAGRPRSIKDLGSSNPRLACRWAVPGVWRVGIDSGIISTGISRWDA